MCFAQHSHIQFQVFYSWDDDGLFMFFPGSNNKEQVFERLEIRRSYLSLTFDEGCSIFNHDHGFILVVRLVYLLLHSPHLDINPLHSRMVWLWCYLCIGNCVQQQDISP